MIALEKINHILIVRLAPLGETVLTTPVIRALRCRFPDAYIAYMAAPTREDLVSANPHLDAVLTYPASVPQLIYQLVRERFQMALVLQPTFRLVLHTFLARIPFRVGFETNAGGRRLLSVAVPNNTRQHEVQRYLDVVRALGIEGELDDEPEVFVDVAAQAWANRFLERLKIADGVPIIGLNPGAATTYRRWPSENFAIVGDKLRKVYDAQIVITAGPREVELANQMGCFQAARNAGDSPPRSVIVKDTTPMQLAALLQRCHLYISNDTGPMHLSTAVRTPTLALFGASNPLQWGPPWEKHRIIAREGCPLMRTLSPEAWDGHADAARRNLAAITPDAVMAAVEEMKW